LIPVKGREAIAAWFTERAPKSWGFSVVPQSLQVDSITVQRFRAKNDHPITLAQAQLQGLLEVTDPEQFKTSFSQGIGRGRAFGCGLLQVVPHIDHPFA
jgi:CRISPR system Cascade subunit CasE